MNKKRLVIGLALGCAIILSSGKAYAEDPAVAAPVVTRLAAGLEGATGSTIGPGRALYVTEGAAMPRPGGASAAPGWAWPSPNSWPN